MNPVYYRVSETNPYYRQPASAWYTAIHGLPFPDGLRDTHPITKREFYRRFGENP